MRAKILISHLFTTLLCGCATGISSRDVSEQMAMATAVVREVSGQDARIANRDGDWKRPRKGAKIEEGSRVRTGPNDTVTVFLGPNGGVMKIMPNSDASFERIAPTTTEPDVLAVISLTAGRIVGDTMQPPGEGKVLIRTLGGIHELR